MRSKLEHTIKDKCTTLEEAVSPIPTIVLDDIVSFGLHPEVETN